MKNIIEAYLLLKKQIEDFKRDEFPPGTIVDVDCDQYRGQGVVVSDGVCNPECIPVMLENGNTWWYPLFSCQVNYSRHMWEPWIKKHVRARNRRLNKIAREAKQFTL